MGFRVVPNSVTLDNLERRNSPNRRVILANYLWQNRQNFRVLKEIGVEEHDDDVRF